VNQQPGDRFCYHRAGITARRVNWSVRGVGHPPLLKFVASEATIIFLCGVILWLKGKINPKPRFFKAVSFSNQDGGG